jgi:hypothetical protein
VIDLESVNLFELLDTQTLWAIYNDLYSKVRNASEGTAEFVEMKRQLHRIRAEFNERG